MFEYLFINIEVKSYKLMIIFETMLLSILRNNGGFYHK